MTRYRLSLCLSIGALVVVGLLLVLAQHTLNPYVVRILNLCAIYTILGASLCLLFGFTGQFSLGHAGFMAVGAYTAALLTMTPTQKVKTFIIVDIQPFLLDLQAPFLVAVLAGGLVAALAGLLVGAPVLRLRGDYLAIATLGFAEIIRIVGNNTVSITNGALGLKGIPEHTSLYWSWGFVAVTLFCIRRLVTSSHGRAFQAVRENEMAAETIGINLFHHKLLSFVISSFFAGVGGALLACLITTIDPKTFIFLLTFNVLIVVVAGGQQSLTGCTLAAIGYTVLLEVLRPLEQPWSLGSLEVPAIPGLRMVLFSLVLLVVIIFFRKGLLGGREFSWRPLLGRWYG